MAAVEVEVTSLRQAVEAAIGGAGGEERVVVVLSAQIDHAAALLELIRLEDARSSWKLEVAQPLKRLAVLGNLLTIVSSAVLPLLAEDPTDEAAVKHLRWCAFEMKDAAKLVGGSCAKQATPIVERLLHYCNQARREPAVVKLLKDLQEMRRLVGTFKTTLVTLSFEEDDE